MATKAPIIIFILIAFALVFLFFFRKNSPNSASSSSAPTTPSQTQATLLATSGKVQVSFDQQSWSQVDQEAEVVEGQTIKTGPDSQAILVFPDGSVSRLDSNTQIKLTTLSKENGKLTVNLFQSLGNTWHRIKKLLDSGSHYQVETSTTVATVRGTIFGVDLADSTTQVFVEDSSVKVEVFEIVNQQKNILSQTILTKDQMTTVTPELVSNIKETPDISIPTQQISRQKLDRLWHQTNRLQDKLLETNPVASPRPQNLKPFLKNLHRKIYQEVATSSALINRSTNLQLQPILGITTKTYSPTPTPTPYFQTIEPDYYLEPIFIEPTPAPSPTGEPTPTPTTTFETQPLFNKTLDYYSWLKTYQQPVQ